MPTFTWIGTARVNTDHIVSIEPKAHSRGNPRWTVKLTDGRTLESDHDLADENGTIIPAPPGLILVEAFPPRPSDHDQTIDYDTATVIAFRVFGGVEAAPITLRGNPPSDRPWAVIQSDGQCIGWGDSWDNLDGFKRSCEHEVEAKRAETAASEPVSQVTAPIPERISSAPEPTARQSAEADPLLALRSRILAEPIRPVGGNVLWQPSLTPAAVIDAVRQAYPALHANGIGYSQQWGWKWVPGDQEKARADMISDDNVEAFEAALRFLSHAGRQFVQTHVNRKRTSYSWKHAAERVMGEYVPNGMLIAAAYALGFQVEAEKDSPHVCINLSEKAVALDPGKGLY